MKILQVISSFPPAYAYGGPANCAFSLSKELVNRGHEITVYTTDAYDRRSRIPDKIDDVDFNGMVVKRYRNISNYSVSYLNLPFSLDLVHALKTNLKKFDIVHLHEYRTPHAVTVYECCLNSGMRYVLQAHGGLPIMLKKASIKKLYDSTWGHKLLKFASAGIALTLKESNDYLRAGMEKKKIHIIPNGVCMPPTNVLTIKGNFKRKLGLDKSNKIILYLGRLHKIKNIDILIHSFHILNKKVPNLTLVIVGPDDGMKVYLEGLSLQLGLTNKVIFIGPLHGEQKAEAYLDSDLFILPSLYDAYPTTVLEACSYGVPIIVTQGVGLADQISGTAGHVVEPIPEKIADASQSILCNSDEWSRFHAGARKVAETKFDITIQTNLVEELYEDVMKGNK